MAYNYNTQRWATGAAAKALLFEQISDELTLLESERGAEYLWFVGSHMTRAEAVSHARRELAALEALPVAAPRSGGAA